RGMRRELKHGRLLAIAQEGQQLNPPIGKFKRIVGCCRFCLVSLSEDCRFVVELFCLPPEETPRENGYLSGKCQFGPRRQTYCQLAIAERTKPACTGAEVTRYQLLSDHCGSRTYAFEAKIAHV